VRFCGVTKQKSSPGKSGELLKICCLIYWSVSSDSSAPNISGWNWHLIQTFIWTGCQGFIGPLPSAFLDKNSVKELLQIYIYKI